MRSGLPMSLFLILVLASPPVAAQEDTAATIDSLSLGDATEPTGDAGEAQQVAASDSAQVASSQDATDTLAASGLPAELVAARIRMALEDPRNQGVLDEIERLLDQSAPLGEPEAGEADEGTVPAAEELAQAPPQDPAQEFIPLVTPPDVPVEGPVAALAETASDERSLEVASTPADRVDDVETPAAEGTPSSLALLNERLRQSRRAVSQFAGRVRSAIPSSLSWLGTAWAPWVVVFGLVGVFLATRAAARPSETRSMKMARRLSRRGLGASEVARRTGLSQDVIQMIEARRKSREVA